LTVESEQNDDNRYKTLETASGKYKFGVSVKKTPFVVPVFIPHSGCPHQCAFCNQKIIADKPDANSSNIDARQQITQFLRYNKDPHRPAQISFFGGNFLGLKADQIQTLLEEACQFIDSGKADGIRFSTRPDTISPETLKLIQGYPVQTIELGVQSMDDTVLGLTRRGHTVNDTETAVGLIQEHAYELGLQMMVGLPGDSPAASRRTAGRLARFSPDFVRIYPTLVLKGSPLARWYKNGKYHPLSLEQAVSQVKSLYLFFQKKRIVVVRMGLQASEALESDQNVLAGPFHPAFGHLVLSSIWLDKAVELLAREKNVRSKVVFHVHPGNISNLRGQKNHNIEKLKQRFHLTAIDVKPDDKLAGQDIRLEWKAV